MRKLLITILLSVVSSFSMFAQMSQRFARPALPSDSKFYTEEIYIHSGQDSIYAVVCIPNDNNAKKPVVIMSHGYGSNSIGFYDQMADLSKEGFITIAFDFCGGARMGKSSGLGRDMSVFTEKQNLIDVIDYVSGIKEADDKNIFLLGESQGGYVSALTASSIPDRIKAIALIYPAFCIQDDARTIYKSLNDVPEEVNFMGFDIGKKYYRDIYDYDIYQDLSKFKKDVLLIHGDNDQVVNIKYARKALLQYDSIEFHLIPGGGHGFRDDDKVLSDFYTKRFFLQEIDL